METIDLNDPLIEPRPYQKRIVTKALQMFAGEFVDRQDRKELAAKSVLIESPTGAGKTIIALTIARSLQRSQGVRVGWAAMRRNLLAQAAEENRVKGFGVEMSLISMFDKNPPAVDLLVVDEAHHDATASMANMHASIQPKYVLGLSSTPFRTDRIKLCFDKTITDAGIHQLIQDGYLSRYRHFTIPEYTPESVARFYCAEPDRWGQSLAFFHTLADCRSCQSQLESRGVRASVVSASSDRDRQLEDFAAGRIDVLLSMMILCEGFDQPSLATVFCRPSGKGCTIQMCGRAFRIHPSIPRKQIVQCRDTRHPFLRTAMADEQYVWVDDRWESLTINPRIEDITQQSWQIISRSHVELPKLLKAHRRTPWYQNRN